MNVLSTLGPHGFWGYSASFDALELLSLHPNTNTQKQQQGLHEQQEEEPLRVLLLHPGDIRHVMTTLSRRRRHERSDDQSSGTTTPLRPVHFYLLEDPMEVLSRDLLLLEILHDFEVPIRHRASVFLEVYGNCLVQERTSRYLEQLGHEMMRSLIVGDGTGRLDGLVDLSLLRYRDHDALEACFKSYAASSQSNSFDMSGYREQRLRGYYGERYDSRKAVSDWDYHYAVRPGASIVHIKQYKEWRVNGLAFEFGDQVYTQPNRTLMSYTEGVLKRGKDRGAKKEVRGFWGDIIASPFFTFGVDSETPNKFAEGLFEIQNKNTGTEQHRHHTVEIAMHNIFSILWEIETGTVYKMTKANDIYSGLGAEAGQQSIDSEDPFSLLETEEDKKVDDEERAKASEEEEGGGGGGGGGEEEQQKKSLQAEEKRPQEVTKETKMVEEEEEEEEAIAKVLLRAETIIQSLADAKVYAMVGQPSKVLDKEQFVHSFDVAFVSARAAACIQHPWFTRLLKPDGKGILAVESSKFIVPLNKKQKEEFDAKLDEFAASQQFQKLVPPPVSRRRRDENDTTDDCFFYSSPPPLP